MAWKELVDVAKLLINTPPSGDLDELLTHESCMHAVRVFKDPMRSEIICAIMHPSEKNAQLCRQIDELVQEVDSSGTEAKIQRLGDLGRLFEPEYMKEIIKAYAGEL